MDYSQDTPFNTYEDIQSAIEMKSAKLSYPHSVGYTMACQINPINHITPIIMLLLPAFSIFLVCYYFSIPYWTMLFAIPLFLVHSFYPHYKLVFWVLSIGSIVLQSTIMREHQWILSFGVGIIGLIIGHTIWWAYISGVVNKKLLSDESLFETFWKKKAFGIYNTNPFNEFLMYSTPPRKVTPQKPTRRETYTPNEEYIECLLNSSNGTLSRASAEFADNMMFIASTYGKDAAIKELNKYRDNAYKNLLETKSTLSIAVFPYSFLVGLLIGGNIITESEGDELNKQHLQIMESALYKSKGLDRRTKP